MDFKVVVGELGRLLANVSRVLTRLTDEAPPEQTGDTALYMAEVADIAVRLEKLSTLVVLDAHERRCARN